jgi:AcrR family transcriptional regulator
MYRMVDAPAQERLIESARDLLWRRGYVGTSPRAIQAAAGAGQGSMYHHFAGKPDLALVAMKRSADLLRADIDSQLSTEGTAVERVSLYLLRERDVLRGCPIGGLAQDPEVVLDPALLQPIRATFEWMRERLSSVLEDGKGRGELRADFETLDTADTVLAVVQGGYVLARAQGSSEPFDRAVRGAISLLGMLARSEPEGA